MTEANPKSVQTIVSLTSYPPRFPYLVQQLNQLRKQTKFPDLLVLNIAISDKSMLPDEIENLEFPFFFEINICEDLGPGKKLIPTLLKYPLCSIITIDDDLDYAENLFENLFSESTEHPRDIIAARTHRPRFLTAYPVPYLDWDFDVDRDFSHVLMSTGGGGTLYPPLSLHSEVTNVEAYKELSYSTDDLWFWVHSLRNGTRVRKTKATFLLQELDVAQSSGLSRIGNVEIINDLNLGLLWNTYDIQSTLSLFAQNFGLTLMQSSGHHPCADAIKEEIGINYMDEFVDLLLSLEPRKRLVLTKIILQKSVELKVIKENQEKLKVSVMLVLRNVLRKIKKLDINA